MHQEIERRWLLRHVPDGKYLIGPVMIRQGYAAAGIRIRVTTIIGDDTNVIEQAFVTHKSGESMIRNETEAEIEARTAKELINLCPFSIRKNRYDISNGNGYENVDLDLFTHSLAGLIILEKEFTSVEEAEEYTLPGIITQFVEKEITDDSRYSNYQLAVTQKIPE